MHETWSKRLSTVLEEDGKLNPLSFSDQENEGEMMMKSDYKNGSGLWNKSYIGEIVSGVMYVDENFINGMKPEKVVENTILFNELMGFKDLNPYVLNDDGFLRKRWWERVIMVMS